MGDNSVAIPAGSVGPQGIQGIQGIQGVPGPSGAGKLVETDFVEVTVDTSTSVAITAPVVLLSVVTTPADVAHSFIINFSASAELDAGADGEISFQIWYGLTGSETQQRSTFIFGDDTGNESGSCALVMKLLALGAGEHTIQIRWGVSTDTGLIEPVTQPDHHHASMIVMEVAA